MKGDKIARDSPNQATGPAWSADTRSSLTPRRAVMRTRHRVLVMHSDQEIRTLIAISLTLEGFDVRTAASAQDCLYKVRAVVPDILITTIVNIRESCERGTVGQLRRHLANSRIKLLLINSAPEPGEDLAVGAGIDACLTTPFDPAEMVRTVRNLAGASQSAVQHATHDKRVIPRQAS